jgi:hypothetical protein
MSLQWSDFPSGQVGLYGSNSSRMLNGTPWTAIGSSDLVLDPDLTLPDRGYVFEPFRNGGIAARLAFNAPDTMGGVAFNLWFPSLDTGTLPTIGFNTAAGSAGYVLAFNNSGHAFLYRVPDTTVNTGWVAVATAAYPVIFANSWNSFEINLDFVSGVYEVRKNGTAIADLTGTDGSPLGGTIGQLAAWCGQPGSGSKTAFNLKNLVVYNGDGSRFNSFLGNVAVNDLYPSGDVDLQWDPSSGSLGYPLIKDNTPGNRLTCTGAISDNEYITIASVRYKWTSGSVDAGTPAGTTSNPWLVDLGATTEDSLANLWNAINATGVAGTTYSTALTAHPTLKAVGYSATLLEIEPQDGLTTAQSCSESMTNATWAASSTFWYGPSDTTYLAADYTPAVSATGSFTVSGGVPIADETFAIGANTFTFKAARGAAFTVPIGVDAATTATNMITYINTDQTVGVAASSGGSGVVTITAITGGTAGNSITTTESATNVVANQATLAGGVNTVYPAADIVSFTDLSADVTSVKGIMSIQRAAKTDGGDGNLQVSLSPNGTDWDAGTDNALTTAQTYYSDTSEVSPATSGAWTVAEVNALQGKLNRTL